MLALEEKESHLNMTGDDRTKWEFFTDDQFWINRMKKLEIQPIKEVGKGFIYQIPANQVTIRKKRKKIIITDAQRAKRSNRMKQMHQNGTL